MSESEDQGITTVFQKGFESPTPSRLNIIRIRGRLIDYEHQRMLSQIESVGVLPSIFLFTSC